MNADHEPFLAAIRATPHDTAARLVYADWLQERDDPRHELIRVCEAMREVPVWSDRYWQLKARRNELWTAAPLDWLESTGYDGSRYDPVFRDSVPADVRGRWRLIREFTERWHGVAVPDCGGREAEVRAEELRLGLDLPESVREFIAYMHDLEQPGTPEHARWRDLSLFHCAFYQLGRLAAHPALSLLYYTLDGTYLGVDPTSPADADPPVHFLWDGRPVPEGVESPVFVEPSLSLAVLGGLFIELPAAGSMDTTRADPDDLLARLAADFPVRARFDDADVFESDEMLVLVGGFRRSYGDPAGREFRALVRRPVPVGSVPEYLFGDDDRRTRSAGLLGPEWFRRQQAEIDRDPDARPSPRWASVFRRDQADRARLAEYPHLADPDPPAAPAAPPHEPDDDLPF